MQLFWIIGFTYFNIGSSVGSGYSRRHAGKFSHELDSHNTNLIVPRKVDHHGKHVSYNLTHYYHKDCGDNDNRLHYHIEFNNDTLQVELEPEKDLIAPQMIIERHRRDLRTRKYHYNKKHATNCHYQGHVKGDHHSRVALSACDGLAGLIRTRNGDFYVEPSKHHKHGHDGHPHVLFQRSAVKDKNKRRAKGSKLKRRKERKKHEISNCGTKEPRRPTETRIEWQPKGKVIVQGSRRTRVRHNKQQQNRKHNLHTNHIKVHDDKSHFQVQKLSRMKRSISSQHHVEVLVVADSSMVSFHQDSNLETYLLIIMNMVSALYKDPAIGNFIKIAVVKIIILDADELLPDLNVTHLAENNLQNFCRWQRQENPKNDNDPHHHDVAILITRKDICSTNGCTTLGVANVGGMCKPDLSCSVNEDNGITLAHTISHELGHNFGMIHDAENNGCDPRTGSITHVMTPSFEADTVQVSWSNCSRKDITDFLDRGLGRCLDDQPTPFDEEFPYSDLPPGAVYNADLQCRLQFNETDTSVRVCSKPSEICSHLWCIVNDQCITKLRPAAPGTACGKHKWCQDQKCVAMEDMPQPIDGDWGNWNKWSKCSRSCGGGISIQSRQCDHPVPAHGGTFCVGERIRYQICNSSPCPDDESSFRAQQCSKFDDVAFSGKMYKWLPYFDSSYPCELYCTDTDDTVIRPGGSAADGTSCEIGTNNLCIAGICRKVGCDWIVDSNRTEDQCGVCGGTGETCTTIKGDLNKKINFTDGYYEIATVPAGSRHIIFEEVYSSKNYLSIGRPNSNESYLNGNRLISMPGEFRVGDAIGLYERQGEQEKLKIPGPIKHEILLNIFVRVKGKNPGIKYEYTLSTNSTLVPVYFWKLGDWAACSATCGGGIQRRLPICFQEDKGMVDDENCWSNAEGTRPSELTRDCNIDPCPAHWWVGPWQLCPITCKRRGDANPVKRRSIMCVNQKDMVLPDLECENEKKPIDSELCGNIIPYCNSDDDNSDEDNRI